MSVYLIWLISLLIIPKASSSLSWVERRLRTISLILLLGKVMAIPYSRYVKEGLVYIALVSPLF